MEYSNPWISIWTHPRATIARIAVDHPNRSLWLLAGIYGFCSLMNMFQSIALGETLSILGIFILAVLLSPLYGYISFSLWSWFVFLVGKWFKGEGTFKTIRAAYAWSCVPMALNIPLWFLMVFLYGHQVFLNFPDTHLISSSQVIFLFVILIVKVVLTVWSLVIYLNALAEVQRFSVLRAILSLVVTGVIVALIFFVLWIFLIYALGGLATSPFILLKPF